MARLRWIDAGCLALAFVMLASAGGRGVAQTAPDIPFAPLKDDTLKDPDNPIKEFRVDFARVEHDFPLSRADLMKLTPENIAGLPQEKVDQIYGRITAGPIPDGPFMGNLFFARGDSLKTRLDEILGGIPGRVAGAKIELLEQLGRSLWKGKVFNREQRILRNMIENPAALRGLVDDLSAVPSTTIPRTGPLARIVPTDKVWLLFPAKLYCGQSLVDARRESVIVDYNYSNDIEGYRPSPDSLAGRNGLKVRDEIRMIRPGFYLGRAYTNRLFLLNFTLYSPDQAEQGAADFAAGAAIKEDCWPGEQARSAGVR